jgi:hypothetical protein
LGVRWRSNAPDVSFVCTSRDLSRRRGLGPACRNRATVAKEIAARRRSYSRGGALAPTASSSLTTPFGSPSIGGFGRKRPEGAAAGRGRVRRRYMGEAETRGSPVGFLPPSGRTRMCALGFCAKQGPHSGKAPSADPARTRNAQGTAPKAGRDGRPHFFGYFLSGEQRPIRRERIGTAKRAEGRGPGMARVRVTRRAGPRPRLLDISREAHRLDQDTSTKKREQESREWHPPL